MALSGGRARSPRLLVVVLVAASLITITVDYREGRSGPLAAAGRTAITIMAPLQEAVSKVTHPVGNFFSTLVRLPSIRAENERLRERVADLETRLETLGSNEARLRELENLFEVSQSLGPHSSTVAAPVISSGVSNLEWTITIGKGTADGIHEDDPVVVGDSTAARLVGHVVRAGSNSAIVQLLIDPDSYVAGRLDTSGATGLIQGNGEQDMRMRLILPSITVSAGERVTTASFRIPHVGASLYPPNILIGTVSRSLPSDASLEKFVTVRPAVDFSALDLVLVVLPDEAG